jgi:hypothetical protein
MRPIGRPRPLAALLVAALSVAFYFTIIGVLEMGVATASLLAFVALSLWIWRPRAQVQGDSHDA